jgi:hypothetical protein
MTAPSTRMHRRHGLDESMVVVYAKRCAHRYVADSHSADTANGIKLERHRR